MKKINFLLLFLMFFAGKVFAAAPVINSVTPDSGFNETTTTITINGENFDSACKVYIGAGGPYIKGSVNTPGNANGVYVSGNYAYVANGYSGLQVINISNPASPSIAGSVDTPDYARGVYVSGNYAYVSDEDSGLQVIDISNPTSPSIVGSVNTPGSANGVYVLGNYAYVANDGHGSGSGLQVIDISNPASPGIVGSVDTPGSANGVYVSGNYAYVADMSSGLFVIDISNTVSPIIVESVFTLDAANGVYVLGNYTYVAAGSRHSGHSGCLYVIDIVSPISPGIVGNVETPREAEGVYVSGNYAYVADYTSGLQVIDISNPASPGIAGGVDTPGSAVGIYVSDNYAYIADGFSGLQVIDISNPVSPSIVGSLDTPYHANGVCVKGNYAYVADRHSGLQVIDISIPANPSIVGSVNTSVNSFDFVVDVSVSGNYAYVAASSSGLQVIDISNPVNPSIVGNVNTQNPAGDVYVSGNYVYVTGLSIIHKLSAGTICDSVNFVNDTTLTAVVPKGLVPGKYNIKIINSSREEVIAHNVFTVSNYRPTHTINALAGSGGSISPSGNVTVNHGENRTFDIIPNPGYYIDHVSVDFASVGAETTYTFNNVTLDHSITAIFGRKIYTITASAVGGGTIEPSGEIEVYEGESETFNISINTGNFLKEIIIDGKSIRAVGAWLDYKFENVTVNHTIVLIFSPIIEGNIDNTSPGSANRVDGHDLYVFSKAFGSQPGSLNWNILSDLNNDNVVDGNDSVILAGNFGKGQ